jgi:hypothetical protein
MVTTLGGRRIHVETIDKKRSCGCFCPVGYDERALENPGDQDVHVAKLICPAMMNKCDKVTCTKKLCLSF